MTAPEAPRASSWRSPIAHPLPWLLALAVAHVAVRVAVSPALKWDEAEQILASQQLQLGYGPQPPLYTWLQWAVVQALGPGVLALSLLKHALLASAYALMWLAGRELLGRRGAWWAAAGLMLLPPLGWYAIRDLTHTVLVTTLTCGAWWLLLRTVRQPRPALFAWLGLVCGLGLLAKYSFALVAAAMLLAALSVPEARRALLSRGWWWTPVVGALVALPHASWLFSHLHEATASTVSKMQIQPERHLGTGLLNLLAVYVGTLGLWALIALWAFRSAWWRGPAAPADAAWAPRLLWRYLALITLALLGMVVLVGVTDFKGRWVVPLLCAGPLAALAARPGLQELARAGRRYTGAVIAVVLFVLVAAGARPWVGGLRGGEADGLSHPVVALAESLRAAGYDGRGRIIAADLLLAGMLHTRFPQAAASACTSTDESALACVADNIDSARHDGVGWLLVSRDDYTDPAWWDRVEQRFPPEGEGVKPQLIELPFNMVPAGAPPARYRYSWHPATQGGER